MESDIRTLQFVGQTTCALIGMALGGYAYKLQADSIKDKDAWVFIGAGGVLGFMAFKFILVLLFWGGLLAGAGYVLWKIWRKPRRQTNENPLLDESLEWNDEEPDSDWDQW